MAEDIGTTLKGENIPDMLKFASWASIGAGVFAAVSAVMVLIGSLGMGFFQLVSLVFGNFTAIVCLPVICMGGLLFIAVFGAVGYFGIVGGLRALKGQAGAKFFMMIGGIANIVVGLMTVWGGFGLIPLGLGGFVLYVIFADEPSIHAFELMEAGDWDKHPHDFTGNPEVTVSAEVAATAAASAKASASKPAKAASKAAAAPKPAKWSGRAYEHGKVYHTAPANLMRGKEAVGGKVLISPDKVRFESHGANIQTGVTEIPIETIANFKKFKSLGIVNNGLTMVTADGKEYKFVVDGRDSIEALIRDIQAAIAEGQVKTPEI